MGDVFRAAAEGAPLLGMDLEEERFVWETVASVLISACTYPLTVTTRTLMQLGYEPFPLTLRVKRNGVYAWYLPDGFSYARQLASSRPEGWGVLFTGFDAASLAIIIGRYTTRAAARYLDAQYPEMGGTTICKHVDERLLTDAQSFRRMIRATIRESAVRIVAIIATRPFIVLCVRQIAQLVGSQTKYTHPMQGLRLILNEEGLPGLFSGLVPQLCGELLMVWGVSTVSFVADRGLAKMAVPPGMAAERARGRGEKAETEYHGARVLIALASHYSIAYLVYPFQVVSTIMACAGSGLAASCLPYHPTFANWQDCYDFLGPRGRDRGSNILMRREQQTTVGFWVNRVKRYLDVPGLHWE